MRTFAYQLFQTVKNKKKCQQQQNSQKNFLTLI